MLFKYGLHQKSHIPGLLLSQPPLVDSVFSLFCKPIDVVEGISLSPFHGSIRNVRVLMDWVNHLLDILAPR